MNSEHDRELGNQPRTENGHDLDENGKVDRIRDILFGSQMRDYDARFNRLDERLTREAMEARGEVQRRIEALENLFKGQIESMTNRLNFEQSERSNALEMARNLAETVKALESRVDGLGEHTGREIQGLREQLIEQSKALGAEMNEKYDQMKAGLNRETEQIRGTMTGRETLAEMLSEVALRLKSGTQRQAA
jgi:hypothetical protein